MHLFFRLTLARRPLYIFIAFSVARLDSIVGVPVPGSDVASPTKSQEA
jgi:hypothetical protein